MVIGWFRYYGIRNSDPHFDTLNLYVFIYLFIFKCWYHVRYIFSILHSIQYVLLQSNNPTFKAFFLSMSMSLKWTYSSFFLSEFERKHTCFWLPAHAFLTSTCLLRLYSHSNIVFNISPFDITKYNTRYDISVYVLLNG